MKSRSRFHINWQNKPFCPYGGVAFGIGFWWGLSIVGFDRPLYGSGVIDADIAVIFSSCGLTAMIPVCGVGGRGFGGFVGEGPGISIGFSVVTGDTASEGRAISSSSLIRGMKQSASSSPCAQFCTPSHT